jgi:hypothetical protein
MLESELLALPEVTNSSPRLSVGFGGNEKSRKATFPFSPFLLQQEIKSSPYKPIWSAFLKRWLSHR